MRDIVAHIDRHILDIAPPENGDGFPYSATPAIEHPYRLHTAQAVDTITLKSDIGNAARFAAQHAQALRYAHERKQWLVFDGRRWIWDRSGRAVAAAKTTALSIFSEVEAANRAASRAAEVGEEGTRRMAVEAAALGKWAVKSQQRDRISAMLALAEPEMPISPDDLDHDPQLLNTPAGTVELVTGKMHTHRRDDYITKMTRGAYRPGTKAPIFEAFLERIFRSSPSIIPYVQKAVGYAATGVNSEQVLFFCFGNGANGKTTLLDAIMHALGGYATKADRELLIAQDGHAHPTNIADLQGRRLVVCSETEDGRRFDEAKLKDLVGETRLKARLLYSDFYEFTASHTIFLYGNHRPIVRGTDHGFWRRMRLIPFVETIGPDERDADLPEKLKTEADGILTWIIEGSVLWARDGLGLPDKVAQATNDYRSEMDSIGLFMADCCLEGRALQAMARDLYAAYQRWCEDAGERALSQKRLGSSLAERGFISERCSYSGRKLWRGIGLPASSNGPE